MLPPPSPPIVKGRPLEVQLGVIDQEPLASYIREACAVGVGPDVLREQLESVGWPDFIARSASDRLVKGVDHPVVWWARYGGVSAFAITVAAGAHLALTAAEDGVITTSLGQSMASAFTASIVAIPVAVWGRYMALRVGAGPGRWSTTRRNLLDVMVWGTAIVAIVRALAYVYGVLNSLFVPDARPLTIWAFLQVLVTVIVSGAMFAFSWRERLHARSGQLGSQPRRVESELHHDDARAIS
jgi:small-conductance mechanosensitive channel